MRVRLKLGARFVVVAGIALLAASPSPGMLWGHAGTRIASAQGLPTGAPTAVAPPPAGPVPAPAGGSGAAPVRAPAQKVQGPNSAGAPPQGVASALQPPSVRGGGGGVEVTPLTNVSVSGEVPAGPAVPGARPLTSAIPAVAAGVAAAPPPPAAVTGSFAVAQPVAAQPSFQAVPSLPGVGTGGLLTPNDRGACCAGEVGTVALLLVVVGSFGYLHQRRAWPAAAELLSRRPPARK